LKIFKEDLLSMVPCPGGLNSNKGRQVSELHLDERLQSSREVIGKHLATGQKKMSTAFNSLWNDIEALREAQRQKAAEQKAIQDASSASGTEVGAKCQYMV
jgi:formiminotetrahydrofolate cyclodeaminase